MIGRRARASTAGLAVALLAACSAGAGNGAAGAPTAPTSSGPVPVTTAAGASPSSPSSTGTSASTGTAPPGAALPDDATCAARVVPAPEIRPQNVAFNRTRGRQKGLAGPYFSRVTGDFVGTTDEILQWAACKWGIDADVVRAQAAKESYWTMDHVGDFGPDAAVCLPGHAIGADGEKGQCPESIGILQMRYQYTGPPAGLDTWPEAAASTAYQVDFTYAQWRSCYEGALSWLNTTDRVGTYAAGDLWGCVGTWFAGRWHTDPAEQYIAAVKGYVQDRIWTSRSFIDHR